MGAGRGAARIIAIFLVYLLTAGLVVLFFSLVVPVIAQQFQVLWDSRDQLIAQGEALAVDIVAWYQRSVPVDIQTQVANLAQQAGGSLARGLQAGITSTLGFVTDTFGFVLGLVVIPFFLFYVLYDRAKVMHGAVNLIPRVSAPTR